MTNDEKAAADRGRSGVDSGPPREAERSEGESVNSDGQMLLAGRFGDINGRRAVFEIDEPSTDSSEQIGFVVETVISPFHCLYQDALAFHTQSRLARSESDASQI